MAVTWKKILLAGDADLVNDTTPQLGGNLDMNDKSIALTFPLTDDHTACGWIITATVDSNSTGFGCPLYLAADGHYDEADADASTTAPAVALALETGTGSKLILLRGIIRDDTYNWTMGPGEASVIYLSTTVGTVSEAQPTGTDDVVQPLGHALDADHWFFNPSMMYWTHT